MQHITLSNRNELIERRVCRKIKENIKPHYKRNRIDRCCTVESKRKRKEKYNKEYELHPFVF